MPNPNVLVVEDDLFSLRLYEKIFLKRGYVVHAVSSVTEARQLLGEIKFSVIICDMQIGDARGVDFIRQEHDHLAAVGTQVIVVSGHEHFRSVCEELGVEFYISKPISTFELGAIVDRLMKMQDKKPMATTVHSTAHTSSQTIAPVKTKEG